MDRICQIHDICTSALGLDHCFCNEQLYGKLSVFSPSNDIQTSEWDSDLHLIFDILLLCPNNYKHLDDIYYIGNCKSSDCNNKGFTYFPVYGHYQTNIFKFVYYLGGYNVKIYRINRDTYKEFTQFAFNNPINTHRYLDNKYIQINESISNIIMLYPNEMLIFLNYDNTIPSFIMMEENNYVIDSIFTWFGNNYDKSNEENNNLKYKLHIMNIVFYIIIGIIGILIVTFVILKLIKYLKNKKQIKFEQINHELSSVNIN